jgi:hypothetical protein
MSLSILLTLRGGKVLAQASVNLISFDCYIRSCWGRGTTLL